MDKNHWISVDKFDDLKFILTLAESYNKSGRHNTLFAGNSILEEINTDILGLDRTLLNEIKDEADRKKIEELVKGNVLENVPAMVKLRNKMEKDVVAIEKVEESISLRDYESFLTGDMKGSFPFKNVDPFEKLSTADAKLRRTIQEMLDKISGEMTEAQRALMKKEEDYLLQSLQGALGWKYCDVGLHCLGTMEQLAHMATLMLTVPEGNLRPNLNERLKDHVIRTFGAYLSKDSRDRLENVALKSFNFKGRGGLTGAPFKGGDTLTSISALVSNPTPTGPNWREYLVLVVYDLYFQVANNLKLLAEETERLLARDGNDNEALIANMKRSIVRFRKLVKHNVVDYFDIDVAKDATVAETIAEGAPGAKTGEVIIKPLSGEIRVIGGDKVIKYEMRLHDDYPLAFKAGGAINDDKTRGRLTKLLEHSQRDLDTRKGIHMGGPVMTHELGQVSVKIIKESFKLIQKNKKHMIKALDHVLKKVRTGIKISDINKMKKRLIADYKQISEVANLEQKEAFADSIFNNIALEYAKMRRGDLATYRDLFLLVKAAKGKTGKSGEELKNKIAELTTQLYQQQIRSLAYKVLAYKIYQYVSTDINPFIDRKDLPAEYLEKMVEMFDAVDLQLSEDIVDSKYNDETTQLLLRQIGEPSIIEYSIRHAPGPGLMRDLIRHGNGFLARSLETGDFRGHSLTREQLSKVQSRGFWEMIARKVPQPTRRTAHYTVFVPVKGALYNSLFDLVGAAIDGKVSNKHFISSLSTKKLISTVYARGRIMVGNYDIQNPDMWRYVPSRNIDVLKKADSEDMLRLQIYNLLADPGFYALMTPEIWRDDSMRSVIVDVCERVSADMSQCPAVVSREDVAAGLRSVGGVPFQY